MIRFVVPALVLALLLALLAAGLRRDPHVLPSPLVGRAAPALALPVLEGAVPARPGAPVLVNFWASWCAPCLEEHPLLLEKAAGGAPIVGVAYKDTPQAARQWLERHGNPFRAVLGDMDGRAGLDWGVYGVPETYVLDAGGVVRFKQVGPMTREVWDREVAPLLRAAASTGATP